MSSAEKGHFVKRRFRWWLLRHGWIACDDCGKMRPRQWAYNYSWWCGGIAGHWDWCPEHAPVRREFSDDRSSNGR